MKNILYLIISSFFFINSSFAAGIDHFGVSLNPNQAKLGEALDLKITALDKNNIKVSDYNGSILIFSETDAEAELPIILEDNVYQFSQSDEGEVIFENAVKFGNIGEQLINVYDFEDDSVLGVGKANIIKDSVSEDIAVNILSPENNIEIGDSNINVSGTTKKNHGVELFLNGVKKDISNSDNEGLFDFSLANLAQGENEIQVKVIDADLNVIGESPKVKVKLVKNDLRVLNVGVIPEEVDSEGAFEVEVNANSGLKDVSVIINDVSYKLEEGDSGLYKSKVYAPQEQGVYKIDVMLTDKIGFEVKELGAASIKVNKIELKAAPKEKMPVEEDKQDLNIKGIKLVELKSKSVLSWDKLDSAISYNIYKQKDDGELEFVGNTPNERFEIAIDGDELKYEYFAIKAVFKDDESKEEYEGNLSEATKVKTGPEMFLLIILALIIAGFIFILRKKAKL